MSLSNFTKNWRKFRSFPIISRTGYYHYRGHTETITYNKGAPQFHTLEASLLKVIFNSIPYIFLGALILIFVFIIFGIVIICVVSGFGDADDALGHFNKTYKNFYYLGIPLGVVAAYLLGLKPSVCNLMKESMPDDHTFEIPKFWTLLFSKEYTW